MQLEGAFLGQCARLWVIFGRQARLELSGACIWSSVADITWQLGSPLRILLIAKKIPLTWRAGRAEYFDREKYCCASAWRLP